MNDKIITEYPTYTEEDPRTSEYYNYMRTHGFSEKEIEKTRDRLKIMGSSDNLTDFFIHEAVKSLIPLITENENGKLFINEGSKEFSHGRKIFLEIRRGLNWFKHDGFLPKDRIESFLNKVEGMGFWDRQKATQIHDEYNALVKPGSGED